MAPPASDLEAIIAALSARVRNEIDLVDAQIAKSRAARGYTPTDCTPLKTAAPAAAEQTNNKTVAATPDAARDATRKDHSQAPHANDGASRASTSAVPSPPQQVLSTSASATAQPNIPVVQALELCQKCGPLLNFGRPRMMASFRPCYFVVDEQYGFRWWDSVNDFRSQPTRPADSIPFFEISSNSRASKFKKAATCWPLVLPEDCAKATDKTVSYFAIEYFNSKSGKTELLVLGATSVVERNEWVAFITKFVKLFLANREESQEFVEFPVGSKAPLHVSAVLDGEAPR